MYTPTASRQPIRQHATTPAEAAPNDADAPRAPSDRLTLTAVGGAALWVLTWLAVQLHAHLGWAVYLLPGSK